MSDAGIRSPRLIPALPKRRTALYESDIVFG
jgi:hypothetical protein